MSLTSEPDPWGIPLFSWGNTSGEMDVCELEEDNSNKSLNTSVIQR